MTIEEWHSWRGKGLGASDSPIIMGVSPWSTPIKLWEEKTKRVKRNFSNFATNRGNRLEPKARAAYELETGLESPVRLVQHPVYDYIRATLDGYSPGVILEIKCPGKVDHAKALEGKVPDKYYPQLQHQLLACQEAERVDYYSFNGECGVVIQVFRDPKYQAILLEALQAFWACVINDTPPVGEIEKNIERIRNQILGI